MHRLYFLLLVSLYCTKTHAQKYKYEYTENCRKAYIAYMALQVPEGNALILQEIRQNPYNLMATYVADYGDFLTMLFNGDKHAYDQCRAHLDERIDILEKGDHHDPWFRFCKAGLYLHWALVRIRFNDHIGAAFLFRKSFIQSAENRKDHPGFSYNQLYYGLEQTIAGTIPDSYKWIAAVLGVRGNVKTGIENLSQFVNTHADTDPMKNEGVIFYLYLRFYLLSQKEEAWKYINSNQFSTHNNLLAAFLKANVALNYRKAEIAVQTLREELNNKYYIQYPIFDYELGCAMLNKLDPACIIYMERFLKKYNGRAYIKDAWQKMALYYFATNNITLGNYCREQILSTGNSTTDADKQAQRFAENGIVPEAYILQARLMIDGGYYDKALGILTQVNEKNLSIQDHLEYYFRMARVYDELGNKEKAIALYQVTINTGRERPEHFAARAALQLGFLYEKEGKYAEALRRYREALSIRDHDFQTSIDQQAKAGINRLTNT